MNIEHYLADQIQAHPSTQPQDIVKQCYQAAYGAEHLLSDPERAHRYLAHEYALVEPADIPLYESISEHICRVNLAAWKYHGLPVDWLFQMFLASASATAQAGAICQAHSAGGTATTPRQEDKAATAPRQADRAQPQARFLSYLDTAEAMILQGQLSMSFSTEDWQAYLAEYKKNGMTAVHHSEAYRQKEAPAYRILQRQYVRLFPILEAAAKYMASTGWGTARPCVIASTGRDTARPCVIAIDGRAASGKTTMARQLAAILDGDIIQMDDFFLPPALRTDERFRTPGGNVHYERFREEVLPRLSQPQAFSYDRFDCHIMDYNGQRHVGTKPFRIVEGSYSCHPQLGHYADITIFSTVDPQVQTQRILRRNGAEMAEVFQQRWIPMEELYIRECGVSQEAMLIVDSSQLF